MRNYNYYIKQSYFQLSSRRSGSEYVGESCVGAASVRRRGAALCHGRPRDGIRHQSAVPLPLVRRPFR